MISPLWLECTVRRRTIHLYQICSNQYKLCLSIWYPKGFECVTTNSKRSNRFECAASNWTECLSQEKIFRMFVKLIDGDRAFFFFVFLNELNNLIMIEFLRIEINSFHFNAFQWNKELLKNKVKGKGKK